MARRQNPEGLRAASELAGRKPDYVKRLDRRAEVLLGGGIFPCVQRPPISRNRVRRIALEKVRPLL
jgi:hypothetical protein